MALETTTVPPPDEAIKTAENTAQIKAEDTPKEKQDETKVDLLLQDAVRERFKDQLKGIAPKKKEEKSPDKVEDTPAEEKKVKSKDEKKIAEDKTEDKSKPGLKVSRKPEVDVQELVRAAADSASAAKQAVEMARSRPEPANTPEKKTPVDDLIAGLPESYREDIPILQVMEKKWPEKYNGTVQKYAESAKKATDYQQKWEKDNAGQAFDPDADEHASFFEKNEVDWSDVDYGRAIASLETEEAIAVERKKDEKKWKESETREAARDLEPVIRRKQAELAKTMISQLEPDFASIVSDDGRVNQSELKKMEEKDPIRTTILLQGAAALASFAGEAEKIFHPSGHFKFDEANPTHMDIYDMVVSVESNIKNSPPSKQRDENGRQFATRQEFSRMTKADKSRHWQLEPDMMAAIKQGEITATARKAIEAETKKVEDYAAKLGYTRKAATDEKPAKTEEKAAVKPPSPADGDKTKVDTMASTTPRVETDFAALLKARLRGASIK